MSDDSVTILPDGSAFFIAEVEVNPPERDPIMWNPYNKVVQDHRNGHIHEEATNIERSKRGLPVPWIPDYGDKEAMEPPVF